MLHNFSELQEWIDTKLGGIALRLPRLVKEQPDSFSCGHNMGYKQALLDLSQQLETDIDELI
jgi:hypothetical protein